MPDNEQLANTLLWIAQTSGLLDNLCTTPDGYHLVSRREPRMLARSEVTAYVLGLFDGAQRDAEPVLHRPGLTPSESAGC
jgi:hypothetical protein